MTPAITILDYLWRSRKTWFQNEDEECGHTHDEHAEGYLDQIPVSMWGKVHESRFEFVYRTEDEWSAEIGPIAQDRALQDALEAHMNAASEIMALQASKERQSSE